MLGTHKSAHIFVSTRQGNENMEFYEYFRTCGFKINSSAKDLKKAAEAIRKEPGAYRKHLTKLKYEIKDGDDIADTWDAAKNWLDKHSADIERDIKYKYEEDVNNIATILEKIAEEKDATKKRIKEETAAQAPTTAEYTIIGLSKDREAVELFTSVPVIKPNQYDSDLMHCFAILGDAPVFRANGICRRLMTKTASDTPKVVFTAGDTGSDGLYADIVSAMALKYERYMNKLKTRISALSEFPENEETHPIEDIFLKEVPTIFRHIVDVKKTYRSEIGEDGKERKFFRCYSVSAKKGAVTELTIDAFVEWLSSHWLKATRGILEQSADYKVFTNDPSEMSVSRFVIWPKAEWENAQIPESWDNVFGVKASPRLLERLYFYTGSLLDGKNSAQQYIAISDPGQTGKSLYTELVSEVVCNLVGSNITVHLDNSVFSESNRFGLSTLHVWNYRIGIINEYDGKSLNNSMGKAIVGGDEKQLEVKNLDSITWDTKQFRLIAPSNNGFVLKSHAVRRRCIPLTFKATHSSIENMNDEDKQKLIADGEAFMKYCWRVYQTSKFRQRDGGYFVACPEDEQLYAEGKFFVPTGEVHPKTNKPILKPIRDDKIRMLRAFSRDPEIAAFYTVDDYEDTELTCSFNSFVQHYCESSENEDMDYSMPFELFKSLVTTYCDVDTELFETFGECLSTRRIRNETMTVFNFHATQYKLFKTYMENHGHAMVHTENGNVFTRIRIKEAYCNGTSIIKPDVVTANTIKAKSNFNANDLSWLSDFPTEEDSSV